MNYPIAPPVFFQQRWRETVALEPAATHPRHGAGNTAVVIAINYLPKTRDDVCEAMVTELHHNPATAHLVRDGAGRSGASKRVEDKFARIGGDLDYSL